MNRLIIKVVIVFLLLPNLASAGWQVADSAKSVPNDAFFQGGYKSKGSGPANAFPGKTANLGAPSEVYAISVSGSLKENIERIMDRYHWKVIWKAPYDYNFDGKVTGNSLPNVMEKLLKPFPLKAVLYMSNRTMTVETRKV